MFWSSKAICSGERDKEENNIHQTSFFVEKIGKWWGGWYYTKPTSYLQSLPHLHCTVYICNTPLVKIYVGTCHISTNFYSSNTIPKQYLSVTNQCSYRNSFALYFSLVAEMKGCLRSQRESSDMRYCQTMVVLHTWYKIKLFYLPRQKYPAEES